MLDDFKVWKGMILRCALWFALSLVLVVAAHPLSAQDSAATGGTEAAEAQANFPSGLDNPDIGLDELKLRVIPLTAEELDALAQAWQAIARAQTNTVVEATLQGTAGAGTGGDIDRKRILELTEQRNAVFDRYSAVVSSFEAKGGDAAKVASYRAYRNAIIVEETQQADFQTLLAQGANWLVSSDGGLLMARNLVVLAAAMIGLMILARIARGYARRLVKRVPDLSLLLQGFFSMVVYWITIAIGLMIVLSALGVDVTPLFALVGGASFIVAFAMQDTLGNLASGLMIMFNRPFDEGDYITAAGTSGTVVAVSIVSTTIKTPDNQLIIIPNSKVWGDVITNTTASDTRRVDLVFGIDYEDDPDKAIEAILNVAQSDPRVLNEPEPWVRVTNLGESSVDLTARLWCRAEDFWELKFALTKAVKLAFDKAGISIPYPHSVEIQKKG